MLKNKKFFAWFLLIILIVLVLILSYVKFFGTSNKNIEERPINNSSSNAIHKALKDITTNFNQNPKVKEYSDNNITLKASVNNYSIYISYIEDTTITYEFTYDNLFLNITVEPKKEEQEKFNIIYQILIEATQQRINNTENIDNIIKDFLTTDANYDGLTKIKTKNSTKYQLNITKKLNIST